jgi:dihydrofolate reductase
MSKLRVLAFSVSADGYSAGPDQDAEHPVGVGGVPIIRWQFKTKSHQQQDGEDGAEGTTGVDDDMVARSFDGIGAHIIGRNMFGPVRGLWPDESWKGWWGDNPIYHAPVLVLTNYAREPIVMQGGTTFHFVTDGIHAALEQAKLAANGKDVRIGGGISTVKQYIQSGLVDDMHFVYTPVLMGSGERLFDDLDLPSLGYEVKEHVSSPNATHVIIGRKAA